MHLSAVAADDDDADDADDGAPARGARARTASAGRAPRAPRARAGSRCSRRGGTGSPRAPTPTTTPRARERARARARARAARRARPQRPAAATLGAPAGRLRRRPGLDAGAEGGRWGGSAKRGRGRPPAGGRGRGGRAGAGPAAAAAAAAPARAPPPTTPPPTGPGSRKLERRARALLLAAPAPGGEANGPPRPRQGRQDGRGRRGRRRRRRAARARAARARLERGGEAAAGAPRWAIGAVCEGRERGGTERGRRGRGPGRQRARALGRRNGGDKMPAFPGSCPRARAARHAAEHAAARRDSGVDDAEGGRRHISARRSAGQATVHRCRGSRSPDPPPRAPSRLFTVTARDRAWSYFKCLVIIGPACAATWAANPRGAEGVETARRGHGPRARSRRARAATSAARARAAARTCLSTHLRKSK